jgi:hypothetical protein
MSTEAEQEGTPVSGKVTQYYPSEGENDPYALYVDGDRYTTFNGEDVEDVKEDVVVRFQYVQNGKHRNVVPGSVEVVDADDEPEVYGSTGDVEPFSPSDAKITSQSVLRSAVLHHQRREDSTVEDVVETAKTFADAQIALYKQFRNAKHGA